MKSQDHWMSKKELAKVPRTKKEKATLKALRRIKRGHKYHKPIRTLVFWPKRKIIALGILAPWKWKLGYSPKNNVTTSQYRLSEKGEGNRLVLETNEARLRFQEGYFWKWEPSFMYLYIFKKGE